VEVVEPEPNQPVEVQCSTLLEDLIEQAGAKLHGDERARAEVVTSFGFELELEEGRVRVGMSSVPLPQPAHAEVAAEQQDEPGAVVMRGHTTAKRGDKADEHVAGSWVEIDRSEETQARMEDVTQVLCSSRRRQKVGGVPGQIEARHRARRSDAVHRACGEAPRDVVLQPQLSGGHRQSAQISLDASAQHSGSHGRFGCALDRGRALRSHGRRWRRRVQSKRGDDGEGIDHLTAIYVFHLARGARHGRILQLERADEAVLFSYLHGGSTASDSGRVREVRAARRHRCLEVLAAWTLVWSFENRQYGLRVCARDAGGCKHERARQEGSLQGHHAELMSRRAGPDHEIDRWPSTATASTGDCRERSEATSKPRVRNARKPHSHRSVNL
jgi:hypothetical protein